MQERKQVARKPRMLESWGILLKLAGQHAKQTWLGSHNAAMASTRTPPADKKAEGTP